MASSINTPVFVSNVAGGSATASVTLASAPPVGSGALLFCYVNTATPTVPTGAGSPLVSIEQLNGVRWLQLYYVPGDGTTKTYAVSCTNGTQLAACMMSGNKTVSGHQYDASATFYQSTSSTSLTSPAITPSANNATVFSAFGFAVPNTFSDTGGFTAGANPQGSGSQLQVNYKIQASAAASISDAGTVGTTGKYASFTVSFIPTYTNQVTQSDTNAIGTDTLVRNHLAWNRSGGESYPLGTETLTRNAQSFTRKETEAGIPITNTLKRVVSLTRTPDVPQDISTTFADNGIVRNAMSLVRHFTEASISLTNTLVRHGMSFTRSGGTENIAPPSGDVLSRIVNFVRAGAEVVFAAVEVVSRTITFTRNSNPSDDIYTDPGETLVRAVQSVRLEAETLSEPVGVITRVMSMLGRGSSDNTSGQTDVVARTVNMPRTVTGDSAAVGGDSVGRKMSFRRLLFGTLPIPTDRVVRTVSMRRIVQDTVQAIVEAVNFIKFVSIFRRTQVDTSAANKAFVPRQVNRMAIVVTKLTQTVEVP